MKHSLPCAAEVLLPHRKPMLFLQQINEVMENGARAELTPETNHLFALPDGSVDPLAFVELLAQLTAAYNGYLGLNTDSQDQMGYLVGLKHFIIQKAANRGDSLLLSVKKETQFENVSYIKGTVTCQEEILAHGSLKLWEQAASTPSGGLDEHDAGQAEVRRIPDLWERWQERSKMHREIIACFRDLTLQEGKATATLMLHPGFIAFKGHFPGHPILPGVIMLKMAMVLFEILNDAPLFLKEIKVAKFAKTILPGALIEIECQTTVNGPVKQIDATIREKGQTCSRMVLTAE